VNFVSSSCFIVRISKNQVVLALFLAVLFSIYLFGCSEQVRLPSAEQLAEFENAGPVRPTVDMNHLVRAKIGGGSYRVGPGDVLEVSMPAVLQVFTAELPDSADKVTPYVCRVSGNRAITFPLIGEIDVAGKSLAEIELAVIDAYYPKYSVIVPPVVARILEYNTSEVSIIGAVQKPGVYSLRSNQMSLVALLMQAEGIVDEGAAIIRITHNGQPGPTILQEEDLIDTHLKRLLETLDNGRTAGIADATNSAGRVRESEPLVLPVKGLNIPFADVALRDGDSVEVERLEQPLFTVIGLVNRPGNFPYPPDVQYNLMQAVGFAGGLNQAAEPRYATVYRQKPDSTIVSAIFKVIDGSKLTNASNVLIKPGDIVAVEHTSRTRTKLFLDRVFRINMGVYVPFTNLFE
jgi:protein involved in polysaccharide export with SLBB domain